MSLVILSNNLQSQENTFSCVILAVLKAGLFCGINPTALKDNGKIEDIDIRLYFGNRQDDYEYFLIDIHEMEWCIEMYNQGTFNKNGKALYLLAGTDNAPSHLCYNFSLQYLRLCPEHLISVYDFMFSLEEIEKIEKNGGWHNDWLNNNG